MFIFLAMVYFALFSGLRLLVSMASIYKRFSGGYLLLFGVYSRYRRGFQSVSLPTWNSSPSLCAFLPPTGGHPILRTVSSLRALQFRKLSYCHIWKTNQPRKKTLVGLNVRKLDQQPEVITVIWKRTTVRGLEPTVERPLTLWILIRPLTH